VKAIATNYRIPYFTISPTFSVCPVHGYLPGEQFHCPKCKSIEERALRDKIDALEKEKKDVMKQSA
jgi:ribonucleoside-triphosphate reductase